MASGLIALALALALEPAWGPAQGADGALVEALHAAPQAELVPLLERGHRRLVELGLRGDAAAALPIAEALFARAPAPWSADSLSLTLTRLGRHERARTVLAALLRDLPPGPERDALRQRRALAALGAGRRDLALEDLGATLAAGDADAALILGMLALREGRADPARDLFRAVLVRTADADPRQAWARRGWGLTMLP